MFGPNEKVLQPQRSTAEERRVSMKKQRESGRLLTIWVNSRNKRLGAALLAKERRLQIVRCRHTNFGQLLVLRQSCNQRVQIGYVGGRCRVDAKRTIVRRRLVVLLRNHNERPRIRRSRAMPSSLATRGSSPQVRKPAERNKPTLGAL